MPALNLRSLSNNPYFWAMTAVLLWSTVATAFKIALDYLHPSELLLFACTSSALALLVVSIVQGKLGQIKIELKQRPLYYLCASLLNPIGYYLVLFGAYSLLPGSQAQPINYTWAISLTILSAVVLKQPISKKDGIACLIGYLGVFVIATKGNIFDVQFDSGLGVGLAVFSTFLWSGFWIINAKNLTDSTVSLTINFSVASVLLWIVLGPGFDFSKLNLISTSAVIYIGLFEMGITFLFWSKAMKLTNNTSVIANLIFLSPFVSLILLHYIRGEQIYFSTLIGLLIIIAALLIQQVKRSHKKRAD